MNYSSRNKVSLLRGGKEYFSHLLQMIGSARESIHLQTYIFEDDKTGILIGNALKAAASRGVQVFVLVDAYGSRLLSWAFINDLKAAGIRFRLFEPLFRSKHFYFGRRLHHKIVVIDTQYALTGGINISDRYNDLPGQPAWLDFALYVEGEAVRDLCVLCWKTWNNFPRIMGVTSCETKQLSFQPEEPCEVSIRRNDWVRRKNDISSTYVNMFRHAQSEIIILCSYFLPGHVIRRHLADAARRGVRIRAIVAGYSDVGVAKYAERYMYDWFLRRGVEIYEYRPAVLHGKIAVCDEKWVTIGSYNINNLSAYASIELNMNVRNEKFAKETSQMLRKIIEKDCIRITPKYQAQSTSIVDRITRWFSYGFIRAGLYLSTFYYRHKA